MMKKNIWIYGLVLGLILCVLMVYTVDMCYSNPAFESNDILGYAVLLVIFSLIFFGVRNYRNKQADGIISFGKAFKMGLWIALIGSSIYVVVWLFYYYLFVPDFIDQYTKHVLIEAEREGADVLAKTKEMAEFKELYKNPFFVILITYFEVFPIGLVVALVSSLILKKKRVETQEISDLTK